MARLLAQQDENIEIYGKGGQTAFQFSAVRPDKLPELEYTLVTIVVDVTGSVQDFSDELLNMLKSAVKGCRKSPKVNNILIRVIVFNSSVSELHGFKPLNMINEDQDYNAFSPGGMTALFDATYESIEATLRYSDVLGRQDYDCNGIIFIITDGEDNVSKATMTMISKSLGSTVKSEKLGSLQTILIGINDQECHTLLQEFKDKAGLSEFISVGNVTPQKLAKLAQFVSKSVSSTSQLIGTNQVASLTF